MADAMTLEEATRRLISEVADCPQSSVNNLAAANHESFEECASCLRSIARFKQWADERARVAEPADGRYARLIEAGERFGREAAAFYDRPIPERARLDRVPLNRAEADLKDAAWALGRLPEGVRSHTADREAQ